MRIAGRRVLEMRPVGAHKGRVAETMPGFRGGPPRDDSLIAIGDDRTDGVSEAPEGDFWRGKKVVVTAGPTYESVDPVRFLGNRSSGAMGYALAAAGVAAGHSRR